MATLSQWLMGLTERTTLLPWGLLPPCGRWGGTCGWAASKSMLFVCSENKIRKATRENYYIVKTEHIFPWTSGELGEWRADMGINWLLLQMQWFNPVSSEDMVLVNEINLTRQNQREKAAANTSNITKHTVCLGHTNWVRSKEVKFRMCKGSE